MAFFATLCFIVACTCLYFTRLLNLCATTKKARAAINLCACGIKQICSCMCFIAPLTNDKHNTGEGDKIHCLPLLFIMALRYAPPLWLLLLQEKLSGPNGSAN